MPRWPAGLHRAGGSGVAFGGRPVRPPRPQVEQYWRRTTSVLHAGANGRFTVALGVVGGGWIASAGPLAYGEQWDVEIVQVNSGTGYAAPPLVTQQLLAQSTGTNAPQPPPVPAQAWLAMGGVNVHLLAQTTQGGNDALTVSCPILSRGETISVTWFAPVAPPWMVVRGTRYTLGPE